MDVPVFKTPYKPEEIQKILQKNIHRSRFYHHHEDAYVGTVRADSFRYCYKKANVKNASAVDIVGDIYLNSGETYIQVKYVSGLLNGRLIFFIHMFLSLVITLSYITESVQSTFSGIFLRLIFGGFLFSAIPLFMGYMSSATPPSKTTERQLMGLLEDQLGIEEVHYEIGSISINEG